MLSTIFFGLIGIGVIVFIHEAGHFIAAKLCGVGVEVFSLGWGKKLVGFERKGTTYQIAWFPIGGFCKLKGELVATNLEDDKFKEVMKEPGAFLGAAWWKKIIIAAAGPLANILFAVIVLAITTFLMGKSIPGGNRIIVSDFLGEQSPAISAGLETGDRVLKIDDQKIVTYMDLAKAVGLKMNQDLLFVVERNGEILKKWVRPTLYEGRGMIGIMNWRDTRVSFVDPEKKSYALGLQGGDLILSINEIPVSNTADFSKVLSESKPTAITLEVLTAKKEKKIIKLKDLIYDETRGVDLGFSFSFKKVDFITALGSGFQLMGDVAGAVFEGLSLLFTFNFDLLKHSVAGPVRTFQMVGDEGAAAFKEGILMGLGNFLRFLGILGTVIAFMNLLPIPALDGGMIIFSLYMFAVKNKVSMKIIYRYQLVGVFIIFILLTIALFSDIFHYIG